MSAKRTGLTGAFDVLAAATVAVASVALAALVGVLAWQVIGRYVLKPEVFDILAHTAPGKGGEIQLTDALMTMAGDVDGTGGVYGVVTSGVNAARGILGVSSDAALFAALPARG